MISARNSNTFHYSSLHELSPIIGLAALGTAASLPATKSIKPGRIAATILANRYRATASSNGRFNRANGTSLQNRHTGNQPRTHHSPTECAHLTHFSDRLETHDRFILLPWFRPARIVMLGREAPVEPIRMRVRQWFEPVRGKARATSTQ